MKKHRFNIYPEMQSDEFLELKSKIALGYDKKQPIYLYQGEIIDGWNRFRACEELKVIPVFENFVGNDTDAINYVIQSNVRRNLNSSQRAAIAVEAEEIIEAIRHQVEKERREKISEQQTISNSKSKVQTCQLIDTSEIKKPERTDTKIATTFGTNRTYVNEATKLKENNPVFFEQVKAGIKTISEVKKEEKKERKIHERNLLAIEGSKKNIDIDFRLGDFETVFSDIKDNSIDCIITDPPYPYEFIECWSKLSKFAKRVLKPNSFCIAYSGQMYLPEVINRMSENLTYYWTFAVYHEGQTQIVNGINLMCRWKPVLIFQNGRKKIENTFQDYFISEQREKSAHDWQQSKSGVAYLIEMFTNPLDIIIDPFAGSGTTLIVGKEKGRIVKGAEINEQTYNIAKSKL